MTARRADAIAFLSRPESYPERPETVLRVETHMADVFLAGGTAWKMKKPLRVGRFDARRRAARAWLCREEARINPPLAPGVYRGARRLAETPAGLAIGGPGRTLDWLVEMRRLPSEAMLDRLIAVGGPEPGLIDRLADRLAAFYAAAAPVPVAGAARIEAMADARAEAETALLRPDTGLDGRAVADARRALERMADSLAPMIAGRAEAGRMREGHGDLRAEHVCAEAPVIVFDRLEFDPRLRIVDPAEEAARLGADCARLGAPRVHDRLRLRLFGDAEEPALHAHYRRHAAFLAAGRAAAHLSEPAPHRPETLRRRAAANLSVAAGGGPGA